MGPHGTPMRTFCEGTEAMEGVWLLLYLIQSKGLLERRIILVRLLKFPPFLHIRTGDWTGNFSQGLAPSGE
jgi:hypothetical protein